MTQSQLSFFQKKNNLLQSLYIRCSSRNFIEEIFGKDEFSPPLPVVVHPENDRKGTVKRVDSIDELFETAMASSNISIPYAEFFEGYYLTKTIRELRAFAFDFDNISNNALQQIVIKLRNFDLTPTYIVNTGNGVQFIYLFSSPLQVYNYRKPLISDLYRLMRDNLAEHFPNLDRNVGPFHTFRPPGSRTKLGETVSVFQTYGSWPYDRLLNKFDLDPKPYRFRKKMIPGKKEPRKNREEFSPNASVHFYNYCLRRVKMETVPSHRYTALLALATVGWKTQRWIDEETVREEILKFGEIWAMRDPKPFYRSEAEKAFKNGYCSKATMTRSTTLEEWFGWSFERKTKRRPGKERLSRSEHLSLVAIQKKSSTRNSILNFMKDNPSASIKGTSAALKMSRNTVRKHLREMQEEGLI